jgi:hypothetical protein
VNREILKRPFDLTRPAVLQYTMVGGRRVLVGVTYGYWQRPGDPLPEGFAGSDDHWHAHDMPELVHQLTRHETWYVRWAASRRLESSGIGGPDGRTELAMLHVWLWSHNPDGLFANFNPALPYLRAGLPTAWARSGDHAAARGIGLLAPEACDGAVDRTRRLVDADRAQQRALREACGQAAHRIAAAQRAGIGGDVLNDIAAHAWRSFADHSVASLTPAQREELASLGGGMFGGHEHAQRAETP